jgi:hypothetical protein
MVVRHPGECARTRAHGPPRADYAGCAPAAGVATNRAAPRTLPAMAAAAVPRPAAASLVAVRCRLVPDRLPGCCCGRNGPGTALCAAWRGRGPVTAASCESRATAPAADRGQLSALVRGARAVWAGGDPSGRPHIGDRAAGWGGRRGRGESRLTGGTDVPELALRHGAGRGTDDFCSRRHHAGTDGVGRSGGSQCRRARSGAVVCGPGSHRRAGAAI